MMLLRARRPIEHFAPAIGAQIIERLGTLRAKRALERANERAGRLGGEIGAATFAIGAHFEHWRAFVGRRAGSANIRDWLMSDDSPTFS